VAEAHTGVVTFVQRFDSGLRLNVHLHSLALDGVYVREGEGGALVFHALAEPTADEVVLEVEGEQIDSVWYAVSTWPVSEGHSLSLDPSAQTAAGNDDPQAWCVGVTAYNGLDYGTRGTANPACP
jgi:hypothetical protein